MTTYLCWICKKRLDGLMAFASHVAQKHHISASQYWRKYGHNNEKIKHKKEAWSVS